MPNVHGGPSKRLSLQAREILDAARCRGEVYLLRSSTAKKWVASGPHHFIDHRNPKVTAAYLKGFHELQSKGLLVHDTGNHYKLAVGLSELGEWLKN
ncbi:MAG TPA: hypothetical protein VFZ27_04410 [Terriglobia bacterium]|nr:hypothetical protein [Terriglobia bacterium]